MSGEGARSGRRPLRGIAGRRPRGRTKTNAKRTLLATIRQIPAYLRLLAGLLTDRRVAVLDKLLVVGAIAYIISPADLIPDVIPFLGQVDDIYLLLLAIQRLIAHAGVGVLADHWSGPVEDLSPSSVRSVLLAASLFLPLRIRRRLRKAV